MPSVLQQWVTDLSMMQQTVLLTAVRGPDGIAKYHDVKYLLRWFRRCVLLSAMDASVLTNPYDANGGSFTGPSYGAPLYDKGVPVYHDWRPHMDAVVDKYLQSLDMIPHHFQMHLMHAIQILGYKHPNTMTGGWWLKTYHRLVHDMHLWPEKEEEMDRRLGDNREQWLERNDAATVD